MYINLHFTYFVLTRLLKSPAFQLFTQPFVQAQIKEKKSASLAFVGGIQQRPVNSPHKGPITRNLFPFCDVIIVASHYRPHLTKTSFTNMGQLEPLHSYQIRFIMQGEMKFLINSQTSLWINYLSMPELKLSDLWETIEANIYVPPPPPPPPPTHTHIHTHSTPPRLSFSFLDHSAPECNPQSYWKCVRMRNVHSTAPTPWMPMTLQYNIGTALLSHALSLMTTHGTKQPHAIGNVNTSGSAGSKYCKG